MRLNRRRTSPGGKSFSTNAPLSLVKAEPIHLFVLNHFADELRATPAEPGERLVDVVHSDRGSAFELQAKLDEECDGGIEGFYHDADVVHPLESHAIVHLSHAFLAYPMAQV